MPLLHILHFLWWPTNYLLVTMTTISFIPSLWSEQFQVALWIDSPISAVELCGSFSYLYVTSLINSFVALAELVLVVCLLIFVVSHSLFFWFLLPNLSFKFEERLWTNMILNKKSNGCNIEDILTCISKMNSAVFHFRTWKEISSLYRKKLSICLTNHKWYLEQ